ncbi:eukaryotic translation initiation factor 4 gamma 3 [Caerostris extrusa]|uniref:Eukaryotic translation initiation factor 4 gamma 3 n=1 Tax=Caerostris extrusa TaxID=172846 RepID=A0AAV4VX13_CAEEX|nr:eukaryotic translation initiation factor 4 gamma 3 [Caerostris extrusa]
MHKDICSIINELCPENFKAVLSEFINLPIRTEHALNVVVDAIYEKAVTDPSCTVFCAIISSRLARVKVSTADQRDTNFRQVMLSKCQKEFEWDESEILNEKLKAIETAEPGEKERLKFEYHSSKDRILDKKFGNLRLIGELFKLNFLIECIVHECIKRHIFKESEESMESVCLLMRVVGEKLDCKPDSKFSRQIQKLSSKALMEKYIKRIQLIVDKPQTSPKVKYMLQGVIDLRKNNWKNVIKERQNVQIVRELHECNKLHIEIV